MILSGLLASAFAADGSAGYNKGFVIADDNFKLKIVGRVQPRYVFESDGDFEDVGSHFELSRARLKLSGHAHDPKLRYTLQVDMGKGAVTLKDYYVDYFVSDSVYFRAGQFKRQASRQQLTSTSSIHLIERSITDKAFGFGRDTGVMVGRKLGPDGGLEWALGLYNGSGDTGRFSGDVVVDTTTGEGEVSSGTFSNVPDMFGPQFVARIGFANSDDVYKENDLKGEALRWGVGAGTMMLFDADGSNDGSLVGNVDYIVKAKGFSHTGAFYLGMQQDGEGWSEQAYSMMGFHAQLGYVIGGKIEPAARYAMVIPDAGDATSEIGAGVNVYWQGHRWKWQTDANMQSTGNADALLVRSQVQLVF